MLRYILERFCSEQCVYILAFLMPNTSDNAQWNAIKIHMEHNKKFFLLKYIYFYLLVFFPDRWDMKTHILFFACRQKSA